MFRHALRLSLAVTAATAIYKLGHVPRGYWLAMTTLLVVKPEFRETFVTGTGRIAGTLIGGATASVLTIALGTHHAVLAVLLLVFVWLGYALFRASYTLFTVCFTGYVVILLTLSGLAGPLAAEYRILNTIAGGMLALLVYAVWPTWESGRARESLAVLIDTLASDAHELLGAYIDPRTWHDERLRSERQRARLARSNAEASVERMLGEPETSRRIDPQLALAILANARRYALGALALHARLTKRPTHPRPALAPLRDQIVTDFEEIAGALRATRRATEQPSTLRIALPDDEPDIDAELDLMVDSVNAMKTMVAGGA